MNIYVFGYGSLMNPASVDKTLPGRRFSRPATLCGYQRKMNAPVSGYLYLNIVPRPAQQVRGVLLSLRPGELKRLRAREPGYDCVLITDQLQEKVDGTVYAFIAPDIDYPDMKIPRSYLETCMFGMSSTERKGWLQDTIIENEIEEDTGKPTYANVAVKAIDK